MTKARDIAALIGSSGQIDNAKITLDANEIPNLDTAKITTGTFADARISSSSVSQHAQSFDDTNIINDISTLALRQASDGDRSAYSTNSQFVDVFQDDSGLNSTSNANRNINEYMTTFVAQGGAVYSGNKGSDGKDGNDHPTGGGAGAGGDAYQLANATDGNAPNGGVGVSSDILGAIYYWGGGGGGARYTGGNPAGSGGTGGGGGGGANATASSAGVGDTNGLNAASNGSKGPDQDNGSDGGDGGTNTGGGGGGAGWQSGVYGGNGGSGFVAVRFKTSAQTGYSQSGGTVTTSGTDTIIKYTSTSGTKNFVAGADGQIRVLIVGAGGGGGGGLGGGGAGGEVVEFTSLSVTDGTTYSITVGAGGTGNPYGSNDNDSSAAGGDGGNSSFGSQTAQGGGGGSHRGGNPPQNKPNIGGAGAGNSNTYPSSPSTSSSSLYYTDTIFASGNFVSTATTPSSSVSEMGAIITYQNSTGTNTLNTDIILELSADGGSNYTTATLTAEPDFSSGIKMAKVNNLSVTAGTSVQYKLSMANQANGSKEARIRGVALQF